MGFYIRGQEVKVASRVIKEKTWFLTSRSCERKEITNTGNFEAIV